MRVVTEGDERCRVAVGHQPDVAALATVTAVGPSHRGVCFAAERHAARAAVTTTDVETYLIYELGHSHKDTGVLTAAPTGLPAVSQQLPRLGLDG